MPSALACVAGALMVAVAIGGAEAQTAPPETAGIVVERVRLPRAPQVPIGDRIATIVRVDLRRYEMRFLNEGHDGERRPLTAWVRDGGLAGGINAGMFLMNGRPCGFLQYRGEVRSARIVARFDSVIAFDPRATNDPAFVIGGTGCERNLESMRASFGSVLQGVRMMVDCRGRPQTTWRTNRYSASLLGADTQGRAVLVHVRTPYRMQHLAEMLAAPELGIRGLAYMEGGPEASVVVQAEGVRVREMGSYEDGFFESDDNQRFWDLPNVVGFAPR